MKLLTGELPMMIMNVFPIGFFFPKQDFVQPLASERVEDAGKARENSTRADRDTVDELEQKSFGMPLYAYRFF
jgi:hypothetical protein